MANADAMLDGLNFETCFFIDCAMKERQSYIFRWHNFLELVQSELLLALPHVLPEHLLQPGDVLLVENSSLPASGEDENEKTLQCESERLTEGWLSQ